ncbi:MAG: 6-carboxytetrahydropterin synthase QueD [Deltaproteobacteria bacterium]|nr:6-carboxytetrahydropterin synthase QueD [Deltaproteobacteria bacterium]
MYEVSIRKSFSAAHTLDIGGKCEDLHGHNFTVDITVSSQSLDSEGLVIDFRILKEWTNDILDELDHTYLNDLSHFKDINPSSESVARFIFDRTVEKARDKNITVSKVTVWESNTAWATYRGTESG